MARAWEFAGKAFHFRTSGASQQPLQWSILSIPPPLNVQRPRTFFCLQDGHRPSFSFFDGFDVVT